jgi:hypothetical protein
VHTSAGKTGDSHSHMGDPKWDSPVLLAEVGKVGKIVLGRLELELSEEFKQLDMQDGALPQLVARNLAGLLTRLLSYGLSMWLGHFKVLWLDYKREYLMSQGSRRAQMEDSKSVKGNFQNWSRLISAMFYCSQHHWPPTKGPYAPNISPIFSYFTKYQNSSILGFFSLSFLWL